MIAILWLVTSETRTSMRLVARTFGSRPEHGENMGKVMVIVRALNGLKSSGAAWRTMFAATLHELGFVPTVADPDVYCHWAKKTNGEE
jgi:hypothetical protein